MGGNGPRLVVVPSSQSLANLDSSSRCSLSSASNGSANVVIMLHPTVMCAWRRRIRSWSSSPLGQSIWDALWHCQEGSAKSAGEMPEPAKPLKSYDVLDGHPCLG